MDINVLRHSTAHLLAHAISHLFPDAKFAIGPAIKDGFYYDIDSAHTFNVIDFSAIEVEMNRIKSQNLPIVRQVLSKSEALDFFKNQPFKLELINNLPDNEEISIYKQGDFVDLCRGPHIASTGEVGSFKLLNVAGAYWHGDSNNKMLQRIYGTVFQTQQELDEYLKNLEEAKKFDHRLLGKQLQLFMIWLHRMNKFSWY